MDTINLNMTKPYSPVMLNTEWSALFRLFLLIFLMATGTVMNAFFVSSFFIEKSLKQLGNTYLALTGFIDLIITGGVMPAAMVVIMAKIYDISTLCKVLQLCSEASVYIYNLLFTMVAVENYIRLCRTRACYTSFLDISVGCVANLIFIIGFAAATVGVLFDMDYNYCTRVGHGNYTFRLITSTIFHFIPFTITTILLVATSIVVRARTCRLVRYKRSQQYNRDYAFIKLNVGCYFFFIVAWLPYTITVSFYPNATDSSYYSCAWIGLARSVMTPILYSCLNECFRKSFTNLFIYCCCKSDMNMSPDDQQRRAVRDACVYIRGDVRAHILPHLGESPLRLGAAGRSRTDITEV